MTDINIILADHPRLGRVRLCECNSIHLSLGPVTINLEPHAFAQALTLMRSAMEQLERDRRLTTEVQFTRQIQLATRSAAALDGERASLLI
jgi:hypothetical protein